MHVGRSYKLKEFIIWTRRRTYQLIILGVVPVIIYEVTGWKWVSIPWTVVALLGTATAFIVGFKNTQTYNRTQEAHQVWAAILTNSRGWAIMCRDFIEDQAAGRKLIKRHLAWLTALRFHMREARIWETTDYKHNIEYQSSYRVPEWETFMEDEILKYLEPGEAKLVLAKSNPATQILGMQSKMITAIFREEPASISKYMELEKSVKDLFALQGRSERIKDTPYPRQYSIINTFFVRLFCFLLPYGMLKEFDELNSVADGLMNGYMVWLVIPFSIIISWMYVSLEQVGESTENPFEGGANDVPISQISRMIEIELLEFLEEKDVPAQMQPENNILV
ncbi:MAG: bestrophin family ion channel [Chitinophagaceae bacterium]